MDDIFFYKMYNHNTCWFCNERADVISTWCKNNDVMYRIEFYDGFRYGIILLEDKDKVYFQLRWGNGAPAMIEDYID